MRCLAYCADSRRLLTTAHDGIVKKWACGPLGAMLIDEFVGHSKGVTSMATAAGGRLLATCSADGSARIWNVDQAKQLHAYHPAKASAAVTNYLSPPPSLLLLSEHRAGMPPGER